jgi:adenylate cyclase
MFEELEAAGLFEEEPDADFRRAAARHLLDAGFTVEDVTAILRAPDPGREMNFRLLCPEPRLTAAEFAARIGVPVERLDQIRLAAGLPPTDPASAGPLFSARDEPTFAAFDIGASMFGEEPLLQFVRVMGYSLAQIAEAAIALFGTQVSAPLTAQHAPADVQFKAELDATRALASVGPSLETLFRFHADTAIRRLTRAQAGSETADTSRLTVGFIDLVGFTPIAEHMDARDLGNLFDEFEGLAFDVIARHDARLVKLIGDAVMFATIDADAACDIALTLVEQFSDAANPVTPRGALALGDMLVRGGDYYGPIVNLAARAADLAVPYEILVTEPVVAAASTEFEFEPAGRRLLKGFTAPVTLATVSRAGPAPLEGARGQ